MSGDCKEKSSSNGCIQSEKQLLLEVIKRLEMGFGDLITLLAGGFIPTESDIYIETEHPTANAFVEQNGSCSSRCVGFALACERYFKRELKVLDLECQGGGLVFDFLLRGHKAIGIHPSEFFKNTGRGYWRLLSNFLFTADITEPFSLLNNKGNEPCSFDVICAWQTLSNLKEDQIEGLLENVKKHLNISGMILGSVLPNEEKPSEYWKEYLSKHFDLLEKKPFELEQMPPCESNCSIDKQSLLYFAGMLS